MEESLSPTSQTAAKSYFRPSLGSLEEIETSDNPSTSEALRNKDTSIISKSASITRTTERVDDWYNDGSRSDRSYEIHSAAVEIATPEDIR